MKLKKLGAGDVQVFVPDFIIALIGSEMLIIREAIPTIEEGGYRLQQSFFKLSSLEVLALRFRRTLQKMELLCFYNIHYTYILCSSSKERSCELQRH